MSTDIVIVGAGGFGREVHDVIQAMSDDGHDLRCVGFLDDGEIDSELLSDRAPFLGAVDRVDKLSHAVRYVIAVGVGRVRRVLDARLGATGREAALLVHPAATIGARQRVRIAPGTIICAGVRITTDITIGRHTHLNLNATVGHDAVLSDYVTVFPGATISGNVRLEDEVSVGTGAAIIQGCVVGARSVIGAGASVVRDIPPDVVAVGVPAKPR